MDAALLGFLAVTLNQVLTLLDQLLSYGAEVREAVVQVMTLRPNISCWYMMLWLLCATCSVYIDLVLHHLYC